MACQLSCNLRAPQLRNRRYLRAPLPQSRLPSTPREWPGSAQATTRSPDAPACSDNRMPSSQILFRETELVEHRLEQTRTDFVPSILAWVNRTEEPGLITIQAQ